MANICLYFHLQVNKRLRSFNIADLGGTALYFDDQLAKNEVQQYISQGFPLLTQGIRDLSSPESNHPICGFLFSGAFWEAKTQLNIPEWKPFEALIKEQQADLISQPYYHSLNFFIDREGFQQEVNSMQTQITEVQGRPASSFFHTALLYNDYLGYWVNKQGVKVTFAPHIPSALADRDMYQLFHPPHCPETGILVPDQALSELIESGDMDKESLYQHLSTLCRNHGLITLGLDLSKLLLAPHKINKLFHTLKRLQAEGLTQIVSPDSVSDWDKTGGVLSIPSFHSNQEDEDTVPWLENPLQKEAWLALYSHKKTIADHPFLQNSHYFLQMRQEGEGKQYLRAYRQFRGILTDIFLKNSNKSS